VERLAERVDGAADLGRLKRQAVALAGLVETREVDARAAVVAHEHGYRLPRGDDAPALDNALRPTLRACAPCKSCASVTSPSAYLLALLDFVSDTFGVGIAELDARFHQRWQQLPLDCDAVERRLRQAALAVEILEAFTLAAQPAWDRTRLYAEMRTLTAQGDPPARPAVLTDMWDASLTELGTTRKEVADTLAAGGSAVDELAARLKLARADVKGLGVAADAVGIADVERLAQLIHKSNPAGLTPGTEPYAEAEEQASAANDRVQAAWIAALRDNLVRLALASAPAHESARRLGDHLHLDLTADSCQFTTRVGQGIVTLQALVNVYRLGRETLPAGAWNEARWRWTRSYGTWHAAQTLFWNPENFTLPQLRRNRTPAFRLTLEALSEQPTPDGARAAARRYEEKIIELASVYGLPYGFPRQTFATTLAGRSYLFYAAPAAVFMTEVEADGSPRSWAILDAPGSRLCGVAAFNERLYLFFSTEPPGQGDRGSAARRGSSARTCSAGSSGASSTPMPRRRRCSSRRAGTSGASATLPWTCRRSSRRTSTSSCTTDGRRIPRSSSRRAWTASTAGSRGPSATRTPTGRSRSRSWPSASASSGSAT
jgi:hypothetical protein